MVRTAGRRRAPWEHTPGFECRSVSTHIQLTRAILLLHLYTVEKKAIFQVCFHSNNIPYRRLLSLNTVKRQPQEVESSPCKITSGDRL